MESIQIRNIGPIINASVELNRLTVIIGPQSSGKSTIAKIVTFCQWLEKYAIVHQDTVAIDYAFVKETLIDYFKLGSYLNNGYYIEFNGDAIKFVFAAPDVVEVSMTENFHKMAVGKIAYIPAERNLVSFPNLPSMKMEYDYVREYIFDWLSIHNKYTKDNAIKLPNLDLKYYYDSNMGDVIELGEGKPILLNEASSGVISIVPLYVYVHYLTKWVYDHQGDASFASQKEIRRSIFKELKKQVRSDIFEKLDIEHEEEFAKAFLEMLPVLESTQNQEITKSEKLKEIIDLKERLSAPHYSRIIMEEPEINLDPNTQFGLVNDLLSIVNLERDKVLLTTHSPYILNHLNLLFKVYDTKNKDFVGLNYDDVNVFTTLDGRIINLKIKNAHLINPEYLSAPLDKIYDQYEKLEK